MAYSKRSALDGETTVAERLQLLRGRYFVLAAPIALLFAVGLASSALLAWVSGLLLALLTLNLLLPRAR